MNSLYAQKRNYFDIADGGLSAVLFVILQYVLVFLAVLILPLHIRQNDYVNIFLNVILESFFVLSPFIISKIKRTNFVKATTLNNKVNGAIIGYALGISVVCLWLFTDLTTVFISLLSRAGYTSPLSGTDINNFGDWALGIITICVIPAFCEEMLFRGVILNSFRGLNKWVGIIVSGVSFMLMHGNPDQTVHQLILGLILGYIAWETRNIWITILVHFFNNFIAITLSLILAYSQQAGAGAAADAVPSIGEICYTLVIGLLLAAAGIWLVYKMTIKLKEVNSKLNNHNPQTTQKENDQNVGETPNQPSEAIIISSEGASSLSAQVSLDQSDNGEQPEIQPKPTKLTTILCVCSYVCFAAYFMYEWIGWLLKGLAL